MARTRRTSSAISVQQTLMSSYASNNPTANQTADLPWWAQAGITVAAGGSWQDALCQSTGICLDGGGGGAPSSGEGGFGPTGQSGPCPEGQILLGNTCVSITDALPGGDPFTQPAGGSATVGAFGQAAIRPSFEYATRLKCPRGQVLGKDNLCYAKSCISAKDRKWRPSRKPPITVRDAEAIRRADRAKNRVKALAQKSGFSCRKR